MQYERSILRALGLVVLLNSTQPVHTSESPLPQPVATLYTAEILPNQKDLTFTTVAFPSDTTIEVIACPTVRRDTTCPSAVFRWENPVLEHVAQMPGFDTAARSSSADGKRILLDFNDRDISVPHHLFDDLRAVITFGMIYPEEVNREVVQVVDSATRRSCFNWHRTFPMAGTRRRSAALSPSGEFVAIKVENSLSVFRLPSACGGPGLTRRADRSRSVGETSPISRTDP
jgi:hypothetical protein